MHGVARLCVALYHGIPGVFEPERLSLVNFAVSSQQST
jgi:hypothetical protein